VTSLTTQPYFDVHAHLADETFSADLEECLRVASSCGVMAVACCASGDADWADVEALARREWPLTIVPCFGLHPWAVAQAQENWLDKLEAVLRRWPDAPVGEIGLDRWKEPVDRGAQECAFRAQWTLAATLGRVAVIHCVQAWGWLEEVLDDLPPLERFVLHAYGGPAEMVESLARRGAWFSFAGNVLRETHLRAQTALQAVPQDRLLVETDAPDIAPPRRFCRVASRSEPANIPAVLAGMAAVRGEDPGALAKQVYKNSCRVFPVIS
jgi:TatD DNase family protein